MAIEEAIVNAVYHRSYEEREPMTIPDKPNSSKQRYRLSVLGRDWLSQRARS